MKLIQTLLFLALVGQITAQKVVLYKNKRDANWPLRNWYQFYVPNIPCSQVSFSCTHGKLVQDGCNLFYTPDTTINATFKAYRKVNKKLIFIDSVNILVHGFIKADAWLAGRSGGTISKKEALAYGGIIVYMYIDESESTPISLKKYRLITIRRDSIEAVINFGNRYNEKAISLIDKLEPGDTLIFAEIETKDWLNRTIFPRPIEFKIKE